MTMPQPVDVAWTSNNYHDVYGYLGADTAAKLNTAVFHMLKPGGTYLAVNYFECGPEGPPWPTTRDEQLALFRPYFQLVADWVPRSYPNRTGRERMFHWQRRAE